jgi:hypothetical protein
MPHVSPRGATYALAALFALALACDLLWMPIQVSDSLGEILDAQQSPSAWASFTDAMGGTAYLRPLRIAQIKALFDLAGGGQYWLVYRGFHALLLIAAIFLFVRALRVETTVDFGAAAFALVVLIGLHTFRGTLQEAFPINHFLEMVVACLITINLARSRGGLGVDIAAAVTFVAAALTLESGLLVWVVAVSAWVVGWRGISRRGIALLTVCLAAYVYLRFGYFSTGVPGLTERSSGYLLERLEPDEIQRRFGAQPYWFHGYNVLASVASVLFAEPQAGIFEAVSGWLHRGPMVQLLLPVISSVLTTALMAWVALRGARLRVFDDSTRYLLVFMAVLTVNAVISFAYTKDEIVSPAGAFYALAAFGVVRQLLLVSEQWRPPARVAGTLLLCVLATLWTVRSVGVHYKLRSQAAKHQIDWVSLPYEWQRQDRWPSDPAAQQLVLQLRRAAIRMHVPNTRLGEPEWPGRLWPE